MIPRRKVTPTTLQIGAAANGSGSTAAVLKFDLYGFDPRIVVGWAAYLSTAGTFNGSVGFVTASQLSPQADGSVLVGGPFDLGQPTTFPVGYEWSTAVEAVRVSIDLSALKGTTTAANVLLDVWAAPADAHLCDDDAAALLNAVRLVPVATGLTQNSA